MKVNAKTKKTIQKYFPATNHLLEEIPVFEIDLALHTHGLCLLQEDLTPWDGIFCGEKGRAVLLYGKPGDEVTNSRVLITWYKVGNKWDVVAYLT